MPMSSQELDRSMRTLRLSGMVASLSARALQVDSNEVSFMDAFTMLVQDELDRRQSRLLERRYSQSGLKERKSLQDLSWGFNPKLPKKSILELGALRFIDAKENVLLIGSPGTGKSHVAKSLALSAVHRGYRVFYREAHDLISEIHAARELGESGKYRAQLKASELLIIDDLFLRKLPASAGEDLAEVLMTRYERASTIVTSNRPVEDWGKLLGDVVVASPLLDRMLHHGHLLKFDGPSWRLAESASRLAKNTSSS